MKLEDDAKTNVLIFKGSGRLRISLMFLRTSLSEASKAERIKPSPSNWSLTAPFNGAVSDQL